MIRRKGKREEIIERIETEKENKKQISLTITSDVFEVS